MIFILASNIGFNNISNNFPFSSETVKEMSLDRRNCISHNESMANLPTQYHPQYYKFYRREGCIIECRAKYSMNKCGCLPYYYPQFEKDAYCNSTGLKCLASISGIFNTSIIVSGFDWPIIYAAMIQIFVLYY